MDKKGQWYTDKNGNHYFVEDGQSPKEGWEASKRRKMISGGKYMTSEDGNDYREVSKDEYDNYESDETSFDENNEDDFGFDEEEESLEYEDLMLKAKTAETDGDKEWLETQAQMAYEDGKISQGQLDDVVLALKEREYNREMQKAQEENAEESVAAEEGQETYSDDDLGYRKNDKGGFDILVKETEDRDEKLLKSVNSRDEARQYIRSLLGKDKNVSDYKEFSSDSEARKYFDEHANELPDGSALYGNKIYLGEDKDKGNPYDPEKLPDEGMSQEELDDAERDAKYEEAGKIIEEAGMKNVDLTAAHRLKNDYVDGKITKEELVEKYKEHFKHSRDILKNNYKNPSEDGIPHKPVDMPKYHREKDHIVIDEGPHKGESYDNEDDYYNSVRSEENLGKMSSKNHSELTGEKILHEGWKRNVPQDKIAAVISRELGVSIEEATEYVKKESELPEAIDFDEWLRNGGKI